MNKISHEEQLLNLCALLSEHDLMLNYATLPSNADVVNRLSSRNSCIEDEDFVVIGENYVTLIVEGNTNTWCRCHHFFLCMGYSHMHKEK